MKNNLKTLLLICFAILSFDFANSQQVITSSKKNEPIEINADNGIEWHKNQKKYVKTRIEYLFIGHNEKCGKHYFSV